MSIPIINEHFEVAHEQIKRNPGRRATDRLLHHSIILGLVFGIVMFTLGFMVASNEGYAKFKRYEDEVRAGRAK
jgi:hypothetical protein